MKKIFVLWIMLNICLLTAHAQAQLVTNLAPVWWGFPMDLWGAAGRALNAAVKYFLVDDNEVVAELVYDGGEGEAGTGGGGGGGGCGGLYTGKAGSATVSLNALTSPLTDIPAEKSAYPENIKIQQTSIADLAQYRIQSAVREQMSLDQLDAEKWAIQYRAQQRAIQAMTDALVMKKAYKDLASIAQMAESGSYSDYSDAASTVATRRLLLDELMALRKRVIAARVRARAETMEMDVETVATAPRVEADTTSSSSSNNGVGQTSGYVDDTGVPKGYSGAEAAMAGGN